MCLTPKSKSIIIHTGNIVNWNRLNKKLTHLPNIELSDCLTSTIKTWAEKNSKETLQNIEHIQCFNETFMEKLTDVDRSELKITVKIFINRIDVDDMKNALDQVMMELDVSVIETVIISVPEELRSVATIEPLWNCLEEMCDAEKIYTLGISDLNTTQLVELYEKAKVKPSINQVNLTTCCVIPPEMNEFAKGHDIQLLTHNDPPVILSSETLHEILSSTFGTNEHSSDWQPSWVARYSVLVKCRGVIQTKGYIAKAFRNTTR